MKTEADLGEEKSPGPTWQWMRRGLVDGVDATAAPSSATDSTPTCIEDDVAASRMPRRLRRSPLTVGAVGGGAPGQRVWYNDWRQVKVPALEAFEPEFPVSVVVPYYMDWDELGRTLAALERQTYPRDLFEVVVVDDGSPEPLTRSLPTPLDVKVAWQEKMGYGAGRARNLGARLAAHDVLVFLDADVMPEAEWLAAHARWHQAVPDAVTLGLRAHVPVDGVDGATIRTRCGSLRELFAGRKVDPAWYEHHLSRTDDLTSKADNPFLVVTSGNLGIRRGFFELVGGFDESFTRHGGEDVEFGYRAYTRGGLLVPEREAFAWHQGAWEEGREEKRRSLRLNRAKASHLIPDSYFRVDAKIGRTFAVPRYVVTVRGEGLPAKRLLVAVERVLSGSIHDLVVRVELPEGHAGREWLENHLGPDPRARVSPSCTALEEFPVSPFHVALPAGVALRADVVGRLRTELGTAVIARSVFPDGSRASIARAWALHRAQRTPWHVDDFGEAVTIPARRLRLSAWARASQVWRWLRSQLGTQLRLRRSDGPAATWRFVLLLLRQVVRMCTQGRAWRRGGGGGGAVGKL